MNYFTLILFSDFEVEAFKVLIVPVIMLFLGGIGYLIKRQLAKRDNAEINAYEQLSKLFMTLRDQLEKKELTDKEKDVEIGRLENCLDDLTEKLKAARLDLLDLRQAMRNIRRFLKEHNIDDLGILETVDELEKKLKEVSECLK